MTEPFGYFRAEPFGWVQCAETDEGAVALYEKATVDVLTRQRDELLAALERIQVPDCECGCPCDCYSWATMSSIARAAIASVKESK